MATLSKALELASKGFYVFPLIQNSKLPAIDGWQNKATRDEETIKKWWIDPVLGFDQDYNVGIFTGRFKDDQALLVVDVDKKGKKNGYDAILELELEGHEFPNTHTQRTPTGGQHLVYSVREAVRQGVDVLGEGLDIRSSGGFIVGEGSSVTAGIYTANHNGIDEAPSWLIRRCGTAREPARPTGQSVSVDVNQTRALKRAIEFLHTAPVAVEGAGGNETTYKVALRLRDFGCTSEDALDAMLSNWNALCQPPWHPDELQAIVDNAYRYGKEALGSAAPEVQFAPAEVEEEDDRGNPFEKMNRQFAYIKAGAFILQETTDVKGRFTTYHLSPQEFHGWFANKQMTVGKATKPISTVWMEWEQRRQYEGVVFMPEKDCGPRWYNLWRGFTAQPAETADHSSVQAFLNHARMNVCQGDEKLFHWLMGFFAHMIQRPYEKPLVALVFKGGKGTGKNALVERVGALFSNHFMVADDERYLMGNFNSHLEKCMFIVLDEAAWAGDKRAEGRLKGLITGTSHNIERKGKEPYQVDNLTRVAIIGNEEWLVPATVDERRFAVFSVGEGRKQDRAFFQAMREGMEAGGYAHLLRYFLDFDLSTVDVNEAPNTMALAEQKHASLEPFEQWWLDCLVEGKLLGGSFGDIWPAECSTQRFRDAFHHYARERNIRSRMPDERTMGRKLKSMAPNIERKHIRNKDEGGLCWAYQFPDIDQAHKDWESYIGHTIDW